MSYASYTKRETNFAATIREVPHNRVRPKNFWQKLSEEGLTPLWKKTCIEYPISPRDHRELLLIGLRTGRSRKDRIFLRWQVLEGCWKFTIVIHQSLVYFRQVYDSVDWNYLDNLLLDIWITSKLVRIVGKVTTDNTGFHGKIPGHWLRISK